MDSSTSSALERDPSKRHSGELGPPTPRKKRSWVWVLMLAALAYGGYRLRERMPALRPPAPPAQTRGGPRAVPVVAVAAHRGDLPDYLNGLGTVTAFNTVTVKSRIDGQLIRVAFQEGQFVHQGDVLAEIDPRPFQVQLEQAQGQMARDQAQLNDAKVNLARYEALYEAKVIPKQQFDTQAATVGQFEGAIEADKAMIDSARLQLEYCRIAAPISGRIGLRLIDVGNMVHANDPNGLVVITQLQPIAVLFTLPEDNVILPTAAVERGPQGTFVYVVNADHKAEVRPITVDTTEGNEAALKAGLAAGELVVVDGQDKLQQGSRVDVRVPGASGKKRGA